MCTNKQHTQTRNTNNHYLDYQSTNSTIDRYFFFPSKQNKTHWHETLHSETNGFLPIETNWNKTNWNKTHWHETPLSETNGFLPIETNWNKTHCIQKPTAFFPSKRIGTKRIGTKRIDTKLRSRKPTAFFPSKRIGTKRIDTKLRIERATVSLVVFDSLWWGISNKDELTFWIVYWTCFRK